MSDWIHCNQCCVRQPSPNLQLFLTECGHIFCQRCVQKTKMEKLCSVCSKPTAINPLHKNMEASQMAYFTPLENTIAKCAEICRYQQEHKDRLFRAVSKKYQYAKNECIKLTKIRKKLLDENRALKAAFQASGANVSHALTNTSTPAVSTPTYCSDRNPNGSLVSLIGGGRYSDLRRPPGFPIRFSGNHKHMMFSSPAQKVPMVLRPSSSSGGGDSGETRRSINPMNSWGELRRTLK